MGDVALDGPKWYNHVTGEDENAWLDRMEWVKPSHSRQTINEAGKDFVRLFNEQSIGDWREYEWTRYDKDIALIDHWRVCHAYPLNALQINLRRMARKFDHTALIAQRTKRLVSIGNKLQKHQDMKLTQMQDIAGCRAVVRNVKAVKDLDKFIRKESRQNHEFATCDDYIAQPKYSGYRGIHLVYRFNSPKRPASQYNGLKIEIQLRSQFQHAWATTVETVGTFLGAALKSSIGPGDWLRFFALAGSAVALREKEPALVPYTPTDPKDLINELRVYSKKLNVANRLSSYANAIHTAQTKVKAAHYFLLELNPMTKRLAITGFMRDKTEDAQKAYVEAEKLVKQNPGTDAVLVSVDSISSLSRAYPNYYADTSVFLGLLEQTLG